jgi:hypothetical protein
VKSTHLDVEDVSEIIDPFWVGFLPCGHACAWSLDGVETYSPDELAYAFGGREIAESMRWELRTLDEFRFLMAEYQQASHIETFERVPFLWDDFGNEVGWEYPTDRLVHDCEEGQ